MSLLLFPSSRTEPSARVSDPTTTSPSPETAETCGSAALEQVLGLVIAWSEAEPHRVGEVALLETDGHRQVLGRGAPAHDGEVRWVRFLRQRPFEQVCTPALTGAGISRHQLEIRAHAGKDVALIEQTGRCPVLINGRAIDGKGVLTPGDALLLKGQLLLYCVRRPRTLPELNHLAAADMGGFGEPDRHGMIGESPAMWLLRDQIGFHAKLDEHLLLFGESGAGKELAARAVHALSPRAGGPFVACSAANLPPGIAEAELFGNLKNYPNAGMPERKGLVGEADGGTLFLDEIGELPHALQAHLLRLLDERGEYQRLGEARPRCANLRVIAATNRAPHELKHDVAARMKLRLAVPGLNERREDVPLLIGWQLRRIAQKHRGIGGGLLAGVEAPRVDAALVEHLLRRTYTTHVRELDRLLFSAMARSPQGKVVLTDEILNEQSQPPEAPPASIVPLDADEVRAHMNRHGGNVSRAAQALGVSRFALHRLLKKYGITR